MIHSRPFLTCRSASLLLVTLAITLASHASLQAQLISGVSVTSTSGDFGGRVGANTVNGSGLTGNMHDTDPSNMWLTFLSGDPSITFDLGANYDLSGIHVWNYYENGTSLAERGFNNVTISTDADVGGGTFQSQGNFTFPREETGLGSAVAFTAPNVRLVKFDLVSNHGSGTWAGLSEVQFTAAAVPEPEHYAVIVALCLLGIAIVRRRKTDEIAPAT